MIQATPDTQSTDLPPHSLEAEQATLGAILLTHPDDQPRVIGAMTRAGLQPKHFYRQDHQEIFTVILELHRAGKAADFVLCRDALVERGRLDSIGGADYIARLGESTPSAVNAEYYAQQVLADAGRREAMQAAMTAYRMAKDPSASLDECIATLQKAQDRLCDGNGFHKPKVISYSEINEQILEWLWPDRLPMGMLNMLAGDGALGKSWASLDLAARVTTGRDWPDGRPSTIGPSSVLLFSSEDSREKTIKKRFGLQQGDPDRLKTLEHDDFSLNCPHKLQAAVEDIGDCRLVIVDALQDYIPGSYNSCNAVESRELLKPVRVLAEQYDFAVLFLHHNRKDTSGKSAHRVADSQAWVNAMRSVWGVYKDEAGGKDTGRRLVLPIKCNLAPQQSGLAYKFVEGAVAWCDDEVTVTADQVCQGRPSPKRNEAKSFLINALAEGPVWAATLFSDAEQAGLTRNTVRRAMAHLGCVKAKSAFRGHWAWRLPTWQGPELPAHSLKVEAGVPHGK